MHVLTLCYEYPPVGGGGGVVAASLARQLVHAGHEVDVVTSRFREQASFDLDDGVRIHRHACRRRVTHFTTCDELVSTLLPAYRVAAALIRQRRPDILHAHFALPSGVVALALSRRFGIPYVLTVHGSDVPGYNPDRFGWQHRLVMPAWRKIVTGAVAVTSPSRYLADLLRRSVTVPVQVVPNGYTPAAGSRSVKRQLVLVVARLFPRKGVQHFLEAIRELDTDWEVVIAGDGPSMPGLQARAANVRPKVTFLGFIDRPALDRLYDEARILVFPSVKENCPMVLLEAMEAGCAIVTTRADGCAEVVGDAGITVPPGEPDALRDALLGLMADEQRCRELGRRASARAGLFGWPRITAMYLRVFNDALSSGAVPERSVVAEQGRERR